MTKENAKDYLPLVQALAEGKTIEYRHLKDSRWSTVERPTFERPPECYRIKREPLVRYLQINEKSSSIGALTRTSQLSEADRERGWRNIRLVEDLDWKEGQQ